MDGVKIDEFGPGSFLWLGFGRALFLHDLITDVEIDVCSHIFHIVAKRLTGLLQGIVFSSVALFQGF